MQAEFLQIMTCDVVEASRIAPGQSIGNYGTNLTHGVLVRPGGWDCYPAFWIRDFTLSLPSGFVTEAEQLHALRLTAACQPLQELTPGGGGIIPAGSIPDHITLNGEAIFYPGTLDDVENQGGEWGPLPPFDNAYFFIEMAWRLVVVHNQPAILEEQIEEIPLIRRLHLAFTSVPTDLETGLVTCTEDNRGVSFGFTDVVFHTGYLLFSSLLRYKAALYLADIYSRVGEGNQSKIYTQLAGRISSHLWDAFAHESGLLAASTGISAQADVWGSAFAVYSGALPRKRQTQLAKTLLELYQEGKIAWKGAIRHVPVGMDYDENTSWERVVGGFKLNTYQNGAYWSMPTGWVVGALAQIDRDAARRLAKEFLDELVEGDYRKGGEHGSPWECQHPLNNHRQNPVYMASVTVPYSIISRL